MKDLNKKKKNAILYCEEELRKTEREAEKDSISLIEAFKSRRKHKIAQLEKERNSHQQPDYDKYEEELLKDIDQLEDQLLDVEMKLQDCLGQDTQSFFDKVKQIIDQMKNKTCDL